jgi:hypothetical protein
MSNQIILAEVLWINYEEKIVLKQFTEFSILNCNRGEFFSLKVYEDF